MTHTYNINIDKNILTEEFIGDVTLASLNEANSSILKNNNFKKGLDCLTDLRKAHLHITYDEMWQHVLTLPSLGINKQAIISERDLEYGTSRQFEALVDGKELYVEVRIFREINEGKKWLNL